MTIEPTSMRLPRLRLGVVGAAAARSAAVDAFAQALAPRVGVPVEGLVFAHYAELLDAMSDGGVEVAWLPPVVASRAQARGRTLPIALPVRSGASVFYATLFTSATSGIKTIADLDGARAAWVDKQSAAGYLVVRAALRARGVELAKAFSLERFFGTHEAVVDAVARGEADVGATFAYVEPGTERITRAGWGEGDAGRHVIALAGPIPVDVVAASIRVPVAMIRAIQKALTSDPGPELLAAARALTAADGFVDATAEHFEPLVELLEHLVDDPRHKSSHPPPSR